MLGRGAEAEMNRWHDALERAAAGWDKSAFLLVHDAARKVRAALVIGVRSEHEARLVLAALGLETEEGINAVLGKDAA